MAKLLLSPHRITSLSHAKISTFVLQSAAFSSSSIVAPSGARRIIGNVSSLTVNPTSRRLFSTRASEKDVDVGEEKEGSSVGSDGKLEGNGGLGMKGRSGEEEYPTGEFEMEEFNLWRTFLVKVRMLFAFPWERVKKGSVLSIKLKGRISDQLASRFSSGLSLPQICENLTKAAYDPRISGVYIQIEPLSCGWGKIEEIRRHILNFKKSGKFILCYIPICGEREYYLGCGCGELYLPPSGYVALYGLTAQATFVGGVLEKVGIEPLIQRIGKYKSAGDSISRKSMSKENCEMLTTLLDNIYLNWLDTVASYQGKKREEIENFLNSGVFQVERLKEEGWITNLMYDDEIISMLKERLGVNKEKNLSIVDYR